MALAAQSTSPIQALLAKIDVKEANCDGAQRSLMNELKVTFRSENARDVDVHFPDDGSTMSLHVTDLGDGLVRIESVPFMTEAANLRDIVKVTRREDGPLEFVSVVEPSNWRVFTFMFTRSQTESSQIGEFCSRLTSLGCYWERNFVGVMFVGVPDGLDVNPNDVLAQVQGSVH